MKITIELDPGELAAAIAQLVGALARPELPPTYPFSGDGVTIAQLDPANNLEFVQKTSTLRPPAAPALAVEPEPAPVQLDPPLARNGFTYTTAPVEAPAPLAPEPAPAPRPAPKPTAQQRLAASKVGADLTAKRRANGAEMEFEEFDVLVRKEVKRLATAGAMPSHAFWDEFRDPALPTLVNVIARYGASGAKDLAKMLGYAPALCDPKPRRSVDEETQEAEAVSA